MSNSNSIPLVGFRSNLKSPNEWSVTHEDRVRVRLDSQGRTEVNTASAESIYFILNGRPKHFKKLTLDDDAAIAADCAFIVELKAASNSSLRSELHILEYNELGERLGTTVVRAGDRTLYTPGASVAWVMPTIRLRGKGEFVLDEVCIDKVDRPNNIPSATSVSVSYAADNAHGDNQRDSLFDLQRSLNTAVEAGRSAQRNLEEIRSSVERDVIDAEAGSTATGRSIASRQLSRELLLELASTLPQSNGSEYFSRKHPYHVAIITDEYMYNFYRDAFEQVTYVKPSTVDDVLSEGFDILLYVSCWKGLANEDWRGVKFRDEPRSALDRLIGYSKKHGKLTVFQSIEDPSNFEYFLPVAEKFDFVFTSDSDCIDRYRETLGHDRVAYLEYGANPHLNNPIGSYRHAINKAFFAGSYPKRYQERIEDMHAIFDSVLSTGDNLTLIDRNFGNEEYAFPQKYSDLALEPVPHDDLQRIHKLFRWSLNFNSIKSSPTMCAMRVYELQAQGKGLISNYSNSVFNKFPEIRIVVEPEQLDSHFSSSITMSELKNNEAQVRNVMTSRTAFDISSRMLEFAGLDEGGHYTDKSVVLFVAHADDRLKEEIENQSYPGVKLVESTDEQFASKAAEAADYIGFVSYENSYGPNYVQDRINAFKYTDSNFVTQSSTVQAEKVVGRAHEYVSDATVAMTIYSNRALTPQARLEILRGSNPDLGNGYAIPPFESSVRQHVHTASKNSNDNFDLTIIVPIYNAGHFLETKCVPSILRNARSDRFEILLIDDGSTDGITPEICRRLEREMPNVRAFLFEPGGSGSASRPRNKGIEIASAPLLAFLDPDNEISDGGYDRLLELLETARSEYNEVKFVSGYQVKVAASTTVTGRHTNQSMSVIRDFRGSYFERGRFPVVSTQAAVMDKSLFEDGELRFVEKAAGQDSLFGWLLLLKAGDGAFTNDVHLIYYAERPDSVTNTVDLSYFEKKLIMEEAQTETLKRHQLIDQYVSHHFYNFLENWYVPKLNLVTESDRNDAIEIVNKIAGLYGLNIDVNDHIIVDSEDAR
ncbi:glycosyltransferase [Brevibacterium sp. SIMBA_078]|uniref:glycosyltransferase n=1 Tax=Brevibacterium sp. SIMBA_078 TaxID=3085816 RepID=UPI0039791337